MEYILNNHHINKDGLLSGDILAGFTDDKLSKVFEYTILNPVNMERGKYRILKNIMEKNGLEVSRVIFVEPASDKRELDNEIEETAYVFGVDSEKLKRDFNIAKELIRLGTTEKIIHNDLMVLSSMLSDSFQGEVVLGIQYRSNEYMMISKTRYKELQGGIANSKDIENLYKI